MSDLEAERDGAPDKRLEQPRSIERLVEASRGSLWLRWVMATALGGVAGGAAVRAGFEEEGFVWLICFGGCGLAVGLAQSLVLKRPLHERSRSLRFALQWGLAGFFGCVAGGVTGTAGTLSVILLFTDAMNIDPSWIYGHVRSVLSASSVLLSALAVGALQGLVLRARIRTPRKWIWACIVGWSAGLATGWWIANATTGSAILQGALGGATGGAVLGAITGLALVRLRVPRSTGFS